MTNKVNDVVIQQSDDNFAPPGEPVLKVSVVGKDVFLSINNFTEDNKNINIEKIAEVMVPIEELLKAVLIQTNYDWKVIQL